MHHQTRQPGIGQQFMTYGPESINVHFTQQRRLQEAALHESTTRSGRNTPVRQWLGGLVITLGTAIAGGAAMIQEHQAAVQQARTRKLAPSR